MEKIVSFKKEIVFDSIYQISSISLEHNVSFNKDNIIKGDFIISGTYKITEASINLDDFSFELPFEINVDKKYDTSNMNADINDFYYEIIDNKNLSLNIEIIINNLEEKKVDINGDEMVVEALDAEVLDERSNIDSDSIAIDTNESMESIFNDLDCGEKYVTYKVHVVSENDSIESIIKEYNVKKSILEEYNDLNDLKLGYKIIIPTNENS